MKVLSICRMWDHAKFLDEAERNITLQLYRTQVHLHHIHRIHLKPAAIRLFDSNTDWGKWDPVTRTIYIARKLVRSHSWFCVESILRHEMAHQYATEFYHSTSPGHDEVFKMCCEKLGVPDLFSKATASLQETPLDWKLQKQNGETEKLLNKVQKLLALATSSNEHEALLAMEKVREIYARHNLAMHLRQEGDTAKAMVHLIIGHKKKRVEAHQASIAGILVGYFFVKVLFCTEYDHATGSEYRAFQVIGTRENVLMAEYVYHFLLNQTEHLVKELKKSRGELSRLMAKSYRLGILRGFQTKLELSDDQHLKNDQPHSLGQALLVLKSDKALDKYLEVAFPKLSKKSSSPQSIDLDTFDAGKDEGSRITLHRGVSSTSQNSGRYLK